MGLMNDVLIAIDDGPKSPPELESVFSDVNPAYVFSAVGRWRSNGYITTIGKGDSVVYKITAVAVQEIKNDLGDAKTLLNNQPIETYLISILGSERNKPEREKIRSFLKKRGVVLINRGLYLYRTNYFESIKEKLDKISPQSNKFFFKVIDIPSDSKVKISFNIEKSLYNGWERKAVKFLSTLPAENNIKRIRAKMLVYELAQIIIRTGILRVQSHHLSKVNKIYRALRRYCYL